jgi:hypothetical protein
MFKLKRIEDEEWIEIHESTARVIFGEYICKSMIESGGAANKHGLVLIYEWNIQDIADKHAGLYNLQVNHKSIWYSFKGLEELYIWMKNLELVQDLKDMATIANAVEQRGWTLVASNPTTLITGRYDEIPF